MPDVKPPGGIGNGSMIDNDAGPPPTAPSVRSDENRLPDDAAVFPAQDFAPGVLRRAQTLFFQRPGPVSIYATREAVAGNLEVIGEAARLAAQHKASVYITTDSTVIIGTHERASGPVTGRVFAPPTSKAAAAAATGVAQGPTGVPPGVPAELELAYKVARETTVQVAAQYLSHATQGSGVVFSREVLPNGHFRYLVATNLHVARDDADVNIMWNGKTYAGTPIKMTGASDPNDKPGGYLPGVDVRVIEIYDKQWRPVAKLANGGPPGEGDPVLIAGFPVDRRSYVPGDVSVKPARILTIPPGMDVGGGYGGGLGPYERNGDAPEVKPGNSGGGVFNVRGEFSGVVGRYVQRGEVMPTNVNGEPILLGWYERQNITSLWIPLENLLPFIKQSTSTPPWWTGPDDR